MEIYISSLAFGKLNVEEIISLCEKHDLALEFSSGLPFREDMDEIYVNSTIKRMPHNYFPAPKDPFVLNLASLDDRIWKRSVEHCIHGLELAKSSDSPFFSAHAGFCIDPSPNELGNQISYEIDFDREACKDRFVRSLLTIITYARKLRIPFLIENNVIASFNLIDQEVNPLLCCLSDEIRWMTEAVSDDFFGVLLDTAHLKVSCKTLRVNLDDEVEKILPVVKGIHHSDNSGDVDNNQKFDNQYWFLKHIKYCTHMPHVIEVKNLSIDEIAQLKELIQSHGN